MNIKSLIIGLIAIIAVVLIVTPFFIHKKDKHKIHKHENIEYYTCSMHPQVRSDKPGQCPICAMNLVPVKSEKTVSDVIIKMSGQARKIAKINTAKVERKFVTKQIRMSGKIDFDETRLSYITSWVNGRLDRLFVDYTGIKINKGEHLVEIYSPELLSAQAEYLQALKDKEILQSVRKKLELLGITDAQIKEIEERGIAQDRMTIYSPVTGIVIDKKEKEGAYVKTGTKIYTIADLSHLWIKLDAYEKDLNFLRYGQEVIFTTLVYPGEEFYGTISFISPVLDEKTRTVKVRVNIENKDFKLKPGMFVSAVINVKLSLQGPVMDDRFKDKWMCPMHPEIVKDEKLECDICEMDLIESAEVLDLYEGKYEKPLVIPSTAPLITGKRAVVYVEHIKDDEITYEGREIILGQRADGYYIVKEGLKAGEDVVVKGNFKIDSAMQIQAKKSMMS